MRILVLATVILAAFLLAGCGEPTLPPTTAGGGFLIETVYFNLTLPFVVPQVAEGVHLHATFYKDYVDPVNGRDEALGDASPFDVVTNAVGIAVSDNGRAPAYWDFDWGEGGPDAGCQTSPDNPWRELVFIGGTAEIDCYFTGFTPTPLVGATSPSTLFTLNLPATVTVSGNGFSSTYGMPVLQYYDLGGTLVAQTTATSIGAGGTSLQAATPSLSQVPTGIYLGLIQNVTSSGALVLTGSATVTVVAPPGYITYVAHNESCTPYEQGTIYWTLWDTWVWNDASGIVHNFPGAVDDWPGGQCGGGPGGTFTSGPDSYGYTMHMVAGGPGSPPGAYITGPGGTQYPIVEPL